MHAARLRGQRRVWRLRVSEREQRRDLHLAAVALQRSEARYRAVVDSGLGLIGSHTLDGELLSVNPAAARGLGIGAGALVGRSVRDVVPAASWPQLDEYLAGLRRDGQHEGVMHVRTAAGEERLWGYRSVVLEESGMAPSVLVHAHDITERIRLEEELRASHAELEQHVRQRTAELVAANAALRAEVDERERAADRASRFARAIETCTDGIVLADLEGRVTEVNAAMVETFAAGSKEALVGRLAFELVVPQDEPRARATIAQLFATGSSPSLEYQIVRFDGRTVPIEAAVALIADAQKRAQGFVVVVRDITDRRRIQDALRRSEAYFRALVENSADAIVVLDEKGWVRARPSIEALAAAPFGYERPEALDAIPLDDMVHPDDNPAVGEAWLSAMQRPEASATVEFRIRRGDGSWATAEATFRNLLHDPAVAGVVATIRDRSAAKHAEDELRRAKEEAEAANRAKSDFLATISHELRSPLHAIIGYADLLREEAFGPVEPSQDDALERIRRRADSLFELISAVLDLSAMDADRMRVHLSEVDLRGLIADVEAETREVWAPSGIDMRWEVQPDLPRIFSDAGKIKIIVKNLVTNAVRFTDRGSIVTSARCTSGGVEIRVADTGIGIPADAQATIFEPFLQLDSSNTRATGGTGLGLHIVARLLVLLHGSIEVESEVGRGSTFVVRLPLRSDFDAAGEELRAASAAGSTGSADEPVKRPPGTLPH